MGVTLLGDAEDANPTSGALVPGHQAKPGGELTAGAERRGIAHRRDDGGCGWHPDAGLSAMRRLEALLRCHSLIRRSISPISRSSWVTRTSPIVVMFFAALSPQFIDPELSTLLQLAILGWTYLLVVGVLLVAWG